MKHKAASKRIHAELGDAIVSLPRFLVSPLRGPSYVPDLSWRALTLFIVLASVVTALGIGLLTGSSLRLWTSLFLMPLASISANSILVLVMVAIVALFSGRRLEWRKVAGLAALSSTIYLTGSIAALAWSPVLVVAFALQTTVFGSALIQRHHLSGGVVWSTVLGLNLSFIAGHFGWMNKLVNAISSLPS